MDPPFPGEGQPSSYTNNLPGHGQQSPCVPELTGMESYYALSSGSQDQPPHLSSTGPLPLGPTLSQHQENQQQPSQPVHDANPYAAITSGFHYPPRNHHQVWPSPPPGPDDYDSYSYQSSPSSGSAPMSCYNPSPISPRTWSSPDFPLPQPEILQSQQNSFKNLRICTPTSNEGYPVRDPRVLTPFAGGCMGQGFENENDGLPRNYSPVTIHSSSAGALSCTSSPQEHLLGTPAHMMARQESPAGEQECRASPKVKTEAPELKGAAANAKAEEPYAKLLYRALMSAPNHAMTLQEIYQWFRENTDKDVKKDKTERRPGKNAEGWQNSIRHNLSMNKAFVKREDKQSTDPASTATDQSSTKGGESKKPTEWKLQDWAVRDGVKSTTKYRKETQNRATGGRIHHHPYDPRPQHGSPISAKGSSNRKGDPSMSKLSMRGRHYTHETNLPPTSHHIMAHPHPIRRTTMPSMYQSQSQSQQGYDDMMIPRIERMSQTVIKQEYSPMTPDSNAFGFMLPEPSLIHAHAANSSSSASNHGTTAYGLPGGAQSMYLGSSPCEYPYGMIDVAGVYQGSGHNTASAGVNERLMSIGPSPVYNWNSQGL
ncbi:forkhead box o4 [Fusarium longipes]|uniref:Forkhead box o4 n=1 Tax=Fusarium longipes TaxID=694270 RepID=A0A395SQZ8_9HYPO|nr:forkhead box o4 [Fusarium longipes]